jgi:GTPase
MEEPATLQQQKDAKKLFKEHKKQLQQEHMEEMLENSTAQDDTVDAEAFEESLKDIKIATIGNVDAGKSTLVGVLTKAILDDGRGKARSLVFQSGSTGHEAQTGRTSSVATEIMGWKDSEQVVADRVGGASAAARTSAWQKIATQSDKVVTFIDLCGHEGYLKTTIFGLIGLCPDYAMIVVNANAGFQKMTREHLGIALALKIPIFIVVTKIDIAPENVYEENMQFLTKMLKSKAVNRQPVKVETEESIASMTQNASQLEAVCPIFCISSVTGSGLPLLRLFLQRVQSRWLACGLFRAPSEPVEFHIDHVFTVPGVGIVVSGLMRGGTVRANHELVLGPDKFGNFSPCRVRTIHYRRVPVSAVESGQAASFAITSMVKKEQLKKSSFRKGMVLVDAALRPQATWEFKVEVVILHHATTIRLGYEPVIHCGVIRQSAKVKHMSEELLRTGDKAIVTFCFKAHPEYLTPGTVLLFREGRTKGLGHVVEITDFRPPARP